MSLDKEVVRPSPPLLVLIWTVHRRDEKGRQGALSEPLVQPQLRRRQVDRREEAAHGHLCEARSPQGRGAHVQLQRGSLRVSLARPGSCADELQASSTGVPLRRVELRRGPRGQDPDGNRRDGRTLHRGCVRFIPLALLTGCQRSGSRTRSRSSVYAAPRGRTAKRLRRWTLRRSSSPSRWTRWTRSQPLCARRHRRAGSSRSYCSASSYVALARVASADARKDDGRRGGAGTAATTAWLYAHVPHPQAIPYRPRDHHPRTLSLSASRALTPCAGPADPRQVAPRGAQQTRGLQDRAECAAMLGD